jgi:perosamine synthetase
MSFIAPAGTRLALTNTVFDLARGCTTARFLNVLAASLASHSGHPFCWPMVSGRAAMVLVLRAMRSAAGVAERDEVLIPGYTCYSVPAAIERAGLVPRLCDVDPETLGITIDSLEANTTSRTLGIVTANLYGVPNQLTQIEAYASKNDLYLLDDAAQSLGARCDNRPVGGFGDVGIYSFDKGKNITSMQGGAIVARPGPLAAAISREYELLLPAVASDTLDCALKLIAYSILLTPALYSLVRRAPGLDLGSTRYDLRYPISRFSGALASVVCNQLNKLDSINKVRVDNALSIERAMANNKRIRTVQRPHASTPVFPRLPLRAVAPEDRDQFIEALIENGIGATSSYPLALVDVPEVAAMLRGAPHDQSGARLVAKTIFTVPTHAYCPANIAQRVASSISGV